MSEAEMKLIIEDQLAGLESCHIVSLDPDNEHDLARCPLNHFMGVPEQEVVTRQILALKLMQFVERD